MAKDHHVLSTHAFGVKMDCVSGNLNLSERFVALLSTLERTPPDPLIKDSL